MSYHRYNVGVNTDRKTYLHVVINSFEVEREKFLPICKDGDGMSASASFVGRFGDIHHARKSSARIATSLAITTAVGAIPGRRAFSTIQISLDLLVGNLRGMWREGERFSHSRCTAGLIYEEKKSWWVGGKDLS